MDESLDAWQRRLATHFRALAAARAATGAPVFALEHGLAVEEASALAAALKRSLAYGVPSDFHWLLWIVYAAELGYDYDGDEYWRSFEARTPRWRALGDRDQIRHWFQHFHRLYRGAKPTGPWAEHFSIIAWPITHAILPRDLQLQFAKTLYDLRHRIAAVAASSDPAILGRLVRESAWQASSRFRSFAEQEELVGRVVLALLSGNSSGSGSLIHEPTLRRIVEDLERTQSAREWLAGARHAITRFKGAARPDPPQPRTGQRDDAASSSTRPPAPSVRPLLVLRRVGDASWDVTVEIPSFDPVASLSPDLRAFLRATRCTVTGGSGTWSPGGWLLSTRRTRLLSKWPGSEEPIVRFERAHPALDHLLRSECRLTSGPVWPCRIGADGLAREVVGRQVRPGQRYVLLHDEPLDVEAGPLLSACRVTCVGISGTRLAVPEAVTTAETAAIERLGLQVCRTVRIWPAGLWARRWDGEGRGEWLTTEAACFGLVHDHQIDAYDLSLDGGPATILKAGALGQPVFVRLPPLPPGLHTLRVKASSRTEAPQAAARQRPAEGVVTLVVREPIAWVAGTPAHGGLVVTVEPVDANLDDLWENRVAVEVRGPEGRQVVIDLALFQANGAPLRVERLGVVPLPVAPNDLGRLLARARVEEHFLAATAAQLVISGEELGEYRLTLEGEISALRWVCRRAPGEVTARLVDETGEERPPKAAFFPFEHPAHREELRPDVCREGVMVPPPGGLFLVLDPPGGRGLIVSAPPKEEHVGLDALGVRADAREFASDHTALPGLVELLELWGTARLAGPLAAIRRQTVMHELRSQLYRLLCGPHWVALEGRAVGTSSCEAALDHLAENVGGPPGFAAAVRRGCEDLASCTDADRIKWFHGLAQRYRVCDDTRLCELALRLASRPEKVRAWAGSGLHSSLSRLARFAILMRGARLATLTFAQYACTAAAVIDAAHEANR